MLRYARCVAHTDLLRGVPVLLVASVAGDFWKSAFRSFLRTSCPQALIPTLHVAALPMLNEGLVAGFRPLAGSCQPSERASIPNLGRDWSGTLGLPFRLRCCLAFEVLERETLANTSVHPGLPKGPPAQAPEPGGMQEGS